MSLLNKHSFVHCLSYFSAVKVLVIYCFRAIYLAFAFWNQKGLSYVYFKKQGLESLRPIIKYCPNQICTLINQLPFHREHCDILFETKAAEIFLWDGICLSKLHQNLSRVVFCTCRKMTFLLRHAAMQEDVVGLGFFNLQKDFTITILWFEKQKAFCFSTCTEIFHFCNIQKPEIKATESLN